MNKHQATQKNLYGFLKNELDPAERRAVETHLRFCEQCAVEFQILREAIALLDRQAVRPSENRSELHWQHFASKVERRIQDQPVERGSRSAVSQLLEMLVDNRKPFGVGFASALSLIAIAFAVWSVWIESPGSEQIAAHESARDLQTNVENASLDSRTQDYLEQSKILLIGLVNADSQAGRGSTSLLASEREVSRMLVRESEDITSKLNDPSQRQLKELVSDLGVILMQMANLETEHETQGVEIVKSGVKQNGIIFRINLEEIRRATRSSSLKGNRGAAKPTI